MQWQARIAAALTATICQAPESRNAVRRIRGEPAPIRPENRLDQIAQINGLGLGAGEGDTQFAVLGSGWAIEGKLDQFTHGDLPFLVH